LNDLRPLNYPEQQQHGGDDHHDQAQGQAELRPLCALDVKGVSSNNVRDIAGYQLPPEIKRPNSALLI